jgi:Flp pilus assembly protein CpaB
MRSRGLVVAIAVVLAVLAAVGVIVYTNQVRTEVTEQDTVPVLVANQDIDANTNLSPLIDQGVFDYVRVPDDALVQGAVTTMEELDGQTTVAPIFAREQIPESRLSSGESVVSQVGVTEGHIGVSVGLETPRGGGGLVQRGDSIAVYATFGPDTPILRDTLKSILSPKSIQQLVVSNTVTTNPANAKVFVLNRTFTVTLVPSVRVLSIQNPMIDEQGRAAEGGSVSMMLDLLPTDARNFVYANEVAQKVWVGLLPPANAEEGYPQEEATIGVDYDRMIGVVKP